MTPPEVDHLRVPVVLTFHPGDGEIPGVPPEQRAKAVLKLLRRRFGFSVAWLAAEPTRSPEEPAKQRTRRRKLRNAPACEPAAARAVVARGATHAEIAVPACAESEPTKPADGAGVRRRTQGHHRGDVAHVALPSRDAQQSLPRRVTLPRPAGTPAEGPDATPAAREPSR